MDPVGLIIFLILLILIILAIAVPQIQRRRDQT